MLVRKIDVVDWTGLSDKEVGGGIHPYHEMLSISEGVVSLQWMGREYVAEAPALFLLPPNTPHVLAKRSAVCRFGYIELDMNGSAEFPHAAQARVWNAIQTDKDPRLPELNPIYELASAMWRCWNPQHPYRSKAGDLMMMDIRKLLLLVACFLERRESRTAQASDAVFPDRTSAYERIQDLMRYMEANYPSPITVQHLASLAHLDVSYFIRLFHKMSGRTPLQYLLDLRLNAAACFLATTTMRIRDITEAVGVPNIHYFSRLFKQKYAASPSLWRIRNESRWNGGKERLPGS
ncbi:helix-turn-helix domain-containing protein [Paenibacillus cymbidii]|uniref:helix-turn-helix domain-containing protein n=1 Tax=Paenibacillus cymbidii TaxID=1639034 RepID=UPI001436B2BB|nr:AraC family transcriptional regulator [Paenibacillus cymbidii]